MSPPCAAFPPSKLDMHVQADVKGKKRKLPGGADVDLTKCALKEMTQYRCFVENSQSRNSPVRCNGKSQDGHSSEPSYHQWSQAWEDE
ncbi:hypothetical protein HER10_EVM0001398 [Colletotrichum scovillei]|uniref:uncharacterized protein n=1 Tax=Colletotrichum scovillei TaxID=1209932 RepID=UPI0015C35624|nr:uncharacterized protein HER10_EVM0001398 [Colletotrichum scovillei]KAF4778207.1 hypothetical protein HER10_EVM0001398 [Colletotrichum scovillei]